MEIKIRELKLKDRKTLTALIRKLTDKVETSGLANIMVSDPTIVKEEKKSEDVFTTIGIEVMKQLLELLEDDIAVWFKDLTGKQNATDDELPFDFETNVIDQLVASKEIEDFFTHALRAFNKMKEYAGQAKTEKRK